MVRALISKVFGSISALALAVACLVASLPAHGDDARHWLDREAKRLIEGDYVGAMAVGWIDAGRTSFANYGETAVGSGRSPDADTVFEIGSMTKVFTGILLADMVERKQVALDDPVAKYLPANVKVRSYKGRQITLLDLATQSSGLPRLPDNLAPKDPEDPYADYSPERLYAFLSGYKLTRAPGAQYEYSNLGMGLLGHALALRAGMSYEALVRRRIFEPLGMSSSAITLTQALKARLAQGYADGIAEKNWSFSALAGAGALRSTVKDLLRFAFANLGQDPGPLRAALEIARQPRRPAGGEMRIGLAWQLLPGGKVWWHNGGTGGYRSLLALDPAAKRAVVVLTSSTSEQVDGVGFGLMKLLAGERPAPLELRPVAAVAPDVLEKYVGQYALAPTFVLTVTRQGGRLMAQATGQGSLRNYPTSETEFYYRVVDARITFVKNDKGEVEKLILHQNGQDMPAKRVH